MSFLSFLNNSFFQASFLPPPLLSSCPAPILCLLSPQFLPRLSISHMFSWGSNRTLTVQDCRQPVCAWRDLHGCTSQADFVLNISPKCTQKTIVRLKGVKSITGRERKRQTFRVSAGFTKPNLKSFLMLPGSELKINLKTKIQNKNLQKQGYFWLKKKHQMHVIKCKKEALYQSCWRAWRLH